MLEDNYEIVSVRPAEAPSELEGSDWHRYEIAQGSNTIRGYRQGSLTSVKKAVKDIVFQLNQRRAGKRGRVHIVIPKNKAGAKR